MPGRPRSRLKKIDALHAMALPLARAVVDAMPPQLDDAQTPSTDASRGWHMVAFHLWHVLGGLDSLAEELRTKIGMERVPEDAKQPEFLAVLERTAAGLHPPAPREERPAAQADDGALPVTTDLSALRDLAGWVVAHWDDDLENLRAPNTTALHLLRVAREDRAIQKEVWKTALEASRLTAKQTKEAEARQQDDKVLGLIHQALQEALDRSEKTLQEERAKRALAAENSAAGAHPMGANVDCS
jgi:hypothetical protein